MQRWPSEVSVHDEDARSRLGHDDAQVDHRCRLAFARRRASNHHRFDGAVDAAEADIGPQRAIGLGEMSVERFVGQNELVLSVCHAEPPLAGRSVCIVARGMIPTTGAPINSSAASGRRTALSMYSSTKINPTPSISARAAA